MGLARYQASLPRNISIANLGPKRKQLRPPFLREIGKIHPIPSLKIFPFPTGEQRKPSRLANYKRAHPRHGIPAHGITSTALQMNATATAIIYFLKHSRNAVLSPAAICSLQTLPGITHAQLVPPRHSYTCGLFETGHRPIYFSVPAGIGRIVAFYTINIPPQPRGLPTTNVQHDNTKTLSLTLSAGFCL